jgi:hypothetical protein
LQEIAYRLTAGKQSREYYEYDYAGKAQIEFQHAGVEGKQSRANNLAAERYIALLLAIATSHKQRMAMLLEDGCNLGLGERAPYFAFLILDLRVNVLGEFSNDVVGLRCRETGFDGFKISIDNLHNGSLYAANAQDSDAYFTELQRNPS